MNREKIKGSLQRIEELHDNGVSEIETTELIFILSALIEEDTATIEERLERIEKQLGITNASTYQVVEEPKPRHYPRGMAVEVEDPDLCERELWYATGDGKFAPRNDLKHSISLTWPTRPAGFDPSKAPDGAKAMVFLNSGGRFWTTSPELHECNSEVEWIEYLPGASDD